MSGTTRAGRGRARITPRSTSRGDAVRGDVGGAARGGLPVPWVVYSGGLIAFVGVSRAGGLAGGHGLDAGRRGLTCGAGVSGLGATA